MRLTLRTLLAWMDDTLDPGQVREIGRQVSESPFAQELTDRINRVTRQRRLSVPSSSGSDATDPNVVASYLDNDLDADGVAEFEKRCLTLDVNLAEVASVHQILSLLGQKVKVPDEARLRMYQLVKGREATGSRRKSSRRKLVKEPVTKPIQPWVVPEPPRRPWIERYGPAAGCLLLIALASWAAWSSLGPSEPAGTSPLVGSPETSVQPAAVTGKEAAPGAPAKGSALAGGSGEEGAKVAEAEVEAKTEPGAATATATGPDLAANAEKAEAAKTAALEKAKPAPLPVVPAGAVGVAEKPDGVLLRYNNDLREWVRLDQETPLKTSDRLLCLEPFRATIDVGKIRIVMVRESEVRILSQPSDPVPAIELVQGKIAVRQPAGSSLKVAFAKQSATLEMSSDSIVGMERVDPMDIYGKPALELLPMGVLCQQGEVTIALGEKHETVKAMKAALVSPAGQIDVIAPPALPPWLTQAEATGYELQVKEQFLKMFHAGRPVLAELVAAIEDDRPEIKQLAIGALELLGDLSLLMPTLSRPNDPVARRIAIAALHVYMRHGPDASARARAALDEEFGEELGGTAQHMLVGYTPEEVSKPELYRRLVELLGPEQESVGLRELALETLKRLTGRDDLGYKADDPAGKGLEAWKDLVRRNELRSQAAPPRQTRTKGQR